ncbi:hypothetical protein HRbin29_01354 [bacterium HR29]|jgi:uncharacterized protein YqgV (UPF0045/DUF77 family)|nr:hypothetical protein HRbin29_01354 [bacterium HR29]
MIAEIQCLPTPAGNEARPYAVIEAAIAAIERSGLRTEVGALGTTVEGPADAVWAAVRAAHEACLRAGAERVVTIVKVAETREGGPTIDALTGRYRRSAGDEQRG